MDGQDLLRLIEKIMCFANIFWKCFKSIFNVVKFILKCLIIVAFLWLIYTHNNFFTNLSYLGVIGIILWIFPVLLNICWSIADFRDFFRFFYKEADLESFGYSAAGWSILFGSLIVFYKISQRPEFLLFIQVNLSGWGFFFFLCFLFVMLYFYWLFQNKSRKYSQLKFERGQ